MDKALEVGVKLYLNGFPKSGTHAISSLAMMVMPALTKANWLGNLDNHAFSTSIVREDVVEVLNQMYAGRYVRGHMAYTPEIAQAFQDNQICKAFIFRDFRDVVVSTAFHAQNEKRSAIFPAKEFYRSLDFNEVMRRVITGDEHIAGIMDRWELFAPWLGEDWVLKIAYEDFVEHQREVAQLFIRYVYGKAARYKGLTIVLDGADFARATERVMFAMDNPDKMSVTYRSGKVGEWQKYFTDEHEALFKKADKNNWLEKLGYVDGDNKWR